MINLKNVDWKWVFISGVSMSFIMSVISVFHPDISFLGVVISGFIFPIFGLLLVIFPPKKKLKSPSIDEAAYIVEQYQFQKERQTNILSFEVVNPSNEFEKNGELLHLSIHGEYCPDASLRGYQLIDLIQSPNYKVKRIVQRGEIIEL